MKRNLVAIFCMTLIFSVATPVVGAMEVGCGFLEWFCMSKMVPEVLQVGQEVIAKEWAVHVQNSLLAMQKKDESLFQRIVDVCHEPVGELPVEAAALLKQYGLLNDSGVLGDVEKALIQSFTNHTVTGASREGSFGKHKVLSLKDGVQNGLEKGHIAAPVPK